jgi:hypothetical protein
VRTSRAIGEHVTRRTWNENEPGRAALLWLIGWHGISSQPVEVVGETRTRYRIRAVARTRLGGPRWLEIGATRLVPKTAITFPKGTPP